MSEAVTNEELNARKLEMSAFIQMADALKEMNKELTQNRDALSAIKVDIAVMKERQEKTTELRIELKDLKHKVDLLQARENKQDGAVTFLTFVKDFGPWFGMLLVLGWKLFEHAPK